MLNDFALISRFLVTGDERCFTTLVERHRPEIRRFFLAQTLGDEALSDDLTQDTFVRVWQRLGSFRQAAQFSTWLRRIAYNLWLDHLKSAPEAPVPLHEATSSGQADLLDDDGPPEAAVPAERLLAVLPLLPAGERICLTMFYLEDLSVKDIARITSFTSTAIRTYLHRGRKRLRTMLKNEE
jgi:RNA polymerase sigma-70 factor (ECF subfamily)